MGIHPMQASRLVHVALLLLAAAMTAPAEGSTAFTAVSYTHLDVYKRQVFDMRRLEKLKTAVLHERNPAPRKFHLQDVAVAGAAKQHRLVAQRHIGLAADVYKRQAFPLAAVCCLLLKSE